MFAWAFPLRGSLGIHGFEPSTAEEAALCHGSWAYFKDADHLVALSAASMAKEGDEAAGEALRSFGGPYRLQSPKSENEARRFASRVHDGARMRDFLIESGRIHPVTLAALKQAGVVYFWWLGPGEAVAQEDGSAWPKGGFVYLYREGDEQFDCFLEVV